VPFKLGSLLCLLCLPLSLAAERYPRGEYWELGAVGSLDRPKRVEGIPTSAYDDYLLGGLEIHYVQSDAGFVGLRYLYGPAVGGSFIQDESWHSGLMERHSLGLDLGLRLGLDKFSLEPHILLGGNWSLAEGPAGPVNTSTGYMEFGLGARYYFNGAWSLSLYTGFQLSMSEVTWNGSSGESIIPPFSFTPKDKHLVICASVDFPFFVFK
jgi:hypothetical protein